MLELNQLKLLAKAVANADPSNKVAYAYGEEKLTYSELNETLRSELNALAGDYKAFRENKYVDAAFYGLRPASTGLIAAAGMTVVTITLLQMDLFKNSGSIMDLFNWKSLILAVIIYILSNNIKQTKKLHPVFFIVGSAIIGILFGFAGV